MFKSTYTIDNHINIAEYPLKIHTSTNKNNYKEPTYTYINRVDVEDPYLEQDNEVYDEPITKKQDDFEDYAYSVNSFSYDDTPDYYSYNNKNNDCDDNYYDYIYNINPNYIDWNNYDFNRLRF